MNKKQFLILVVLVVVLGAWGLSRWRSQSSAFSGGGSVAGQKLLGEFDVNSVAQIAIKQGTNELLLAKKDDTWRVAQRNDYPANFGEISAFLLKLKGLKIVQTEQVGPSLLPRLELAASGTNAPTVVEFRDVTGKALKTLTLGKTLMENSAANAGMDEFGGGGGYPKGRYVQVGGMTDSVAVISDALTDISPDASHWLNKNFFKVEKPKTIGVTFPEATNSWTLTRETEAGEWKLVDAKAHEKLDSGKSAGVTSPFSSPTLNDVALGLTPGQAGLDKPTVIKISTFDGFDYTVNVGAKTNENFLLTVAVAGNFPKERPAVADEKPEDKTKADKEFADKLKAQQEKLTTEAAFGKWTFQVASWTVEPLLKKRSELLEDKPAPTESETSTNAPAGL
jgi:archaellum component FlaG (FlaF/FlaG flagellin family)